jgi:threonine aldolase
MSSSPDSPAPVRRRQFASDNYSGVCPEAWAALEKVNRDHVQSYGADDWTTEACDAIREFFETDCEVFFVFNGTAANSLALASMCHSYHSVICHELAHVETDECGAPEFFSNGTKILLVPGANGKLDLAAVEGRVHSRTDIHYPKPRVVSITQATEVGTVYSVDEVRAVGELVRRLGLRLHMDGARLCNALATLAVPPRAITWEAGVDVLCFGMTKNGILAGEAVVFFNKDLAVEFDYRCKQAGQLASKMRFLSAPWTAMLASGAAMRNAARANACAQRLEAGIRSLGRIEIMYPRQANSVFVQLSPALAEALHDRGWHFYTFIGNGGARLMCGWDTADEDVDAFLRDLRELGE